MMSLIKPLMLIALLIALGVGARAEMFTPPLISRPRVIPAGDGLRDARSPRTTRAFLGAQAEALIQHN